MGTTTNFSLRYPGSADAVNVHTDIQELAEDVDGDLTTIQALFTGLKTWTTFTPTFANNQISGTPAAIAKTTTRAGYWRLGSGAGSIIIAQAEITASAAAANGAAIGLPVTAAERWLICGVCGIFGGTPPASQTFTAYMAASLDKLHFVSNTNAFLDVASGQNVRYLVIYKAAS